MDTSTRSEFVDGQPATDPDPGAYLGSSCYLDCHSAPVRAFVARSIEGCADEVEKAVALFYAVRDRIRYNPYAISARPGDYVASHVLTTGDGWCVSKGAAMTACARAAGIPARPGYADVRNHLTSKRLAEQMGCDVFAYHGYVELWLNARWVKVTPVFNIELCEKFGVSAQEFDGSGDSLFQEFDAHGRRHMEYLQDRGPYTDVPFNEIMMDFEARYPRLFASLERGLAGDFAAEAQSERVG